MDVSEKMEHLNDWREKAFAEITRVHGKLTFTNHAIFKKDMKRFEKLWRKDRTLFEEELRTYYDKYILRKE
jgi:hypothetical protein